MRLYYIVLLIWNIIVMFFYGTDKLFAKKRLRRISEKALITSAFLLGGIGAMFGMVLFNHKTSKMKFRILVPFAAVSNIILMIWLKTSILQ